MHWQPRSARTSSGRPPGTPPGTVYARPPSASCWPTRPVGVFNLAFGAQAFVSAAMYFQARVEWGWDIVPAFVLSVLVLAPLIGLVLERLIFRHLRTSTAAAKLVVAIGLRWPSQPVPDRGRLRRGGRADARGHRARRGDRVLRPVRGLQLQPQRAGGDGRGGRGWQPWPGCSGTPTSAWRCGRSSRAPA